MKTFIAFMAGAIVGGIATYIYVDKKKTAEFEEELELYKEHYENKNQNKDESVSDDPDGDSDADIPSEVVEKVAEMQESLKKHKIAYNKIIDEKGYDTMEIKKDPYVISADDFYGNRFNSYDRVELYFNPDDGELFDVDGEFVEDADEMVGMANLSILTERVEKEVYICNPEREALYNVCIEEP